MACRYNTTRHDLPKEKFDANILNPEIPGKGDERRSGDQERSHLDDITGGSWGGDIAITAIQWAVAERIGKGMLDGADLIARPGFIWTHYVESSLVTALGVWPIGVLPWLSHSNLRSIEISMCWGQMAFNTLWNGSSRIIGFVSSSPSVFLARVLKRWRGLSASDESLYGHGKSWPCESFEFSGVLAVRLTCWRSGCLPMVARWPAPELSGCATMLFSKPALPPTWSHHSQRAGRMVRGLSFSFVRIGFQVCALAELSMKNIQLSGFVQTTHRWKCEEGHLINWSAGLLGRPLHMSYGLAVVGCIAFRLLDRGLMRQVLRADIASVFVEGPGWTGFVGRQLLLMKRFPQRRHFHRGAKRR